MIIVIIILKITNMFNEIVTKVNESPTKECKLNRRFRQGDSLTSFFVSYSCVRSHRVSKGSKICKYKRQS